MSHFHDLATVLAGGAAPNTIRVGTVDAVGARNDGGATYTVVTIDDRDMRCLASYTAPAVGHIVIWLETAMASVCLGPML